MGYEPTNRKPQVREKETQIPEGYLRVGFIFESFISFLKSGILVEISPSQSGGVTLP